MVKHGHQFLKKTFPCPSLNLDSRITVVRASPKFNLNLISEYLPSKNPDLTSRKVHCDGGIGFTTSKGIMVLLTLSRFLFLTFFRPSSSSGATDSSRN